MIKNPVVSPIVDPVQLISTIFCSAVLFIILSLHNTILQKHFTDQF